MSMALPSRSRITAFITTLLVAAAGLLHAALPATRPATEFMRFVPMPGGGQLDAAAVTYRDAAGRRVTLVAAVHVADASFYDALNASFATFDAVLYEMVKPHDANVPKPGAPADHPVGTIQRMMTDVLHLSYQLDAVDYTKPNFVHADMDAEQFFDREAARDESIFSVMLKAAFEQASRPPAAGQAPPDISLGELLVALHSPDRPRQLKLILAHQMGDIDDQLAGLTGTVLLTERNAQAMKVLREQLDAGKRNVAIFYGAAHLRGMEQTIEDDLHFVPVSTTWRTAWDMAAPPATHPSPASAAAGNG